MAIAVVAGLYSFRGSPSAPEQTSAVGSGSSTAANPYEQQRTAGATRLLDQWSAAVRSDNEGVLRNLFDREASPEFVTAELARARNLRSVPLSDWGYELGTGPETPVPPALADSLRATDVWAPTVSLRYAIAGGDRTPIRRPVALVIARRGDDWKLVGDSGFVGSDRHTWRGPWDFGPVVARTVATGDHSTSVVLGHPQQQKLIDDLATELPSAVAAVSSFWGTEWPRSAVLETASSSEEFDALVDTSGSAGPAMNPDVAAVTISDVVPAGSNVATGQRVIFGDGASTQLSALTLRTVLRHELTHVAARTRTTDGSPLWVLEGVADYSGYLGLGLTPSQVAPTLSKIVAAGGAPRVLPGDADFVAGGTRANVAYEAAWSIWAFVSAEFGEPKVKEMYLILAAGPVSAESLDGRLTSATGLGTEAFIARWGQWVVANTA